MPFYRRKPTTKGRGRRPAAKPKTTVATLQKKVAKLTKEVKVSAPVKEWNTDSQINKDITSTASVELYDVAALMPSTDEDTKTYLHYFESMGLLSQDVVSNTAEFARFVIVQDMRKFDGDTPPTWTDVFQSETVYSPRRDGQTSSLNDFKVLVDRTYKLAYDADADIASSRKIIKWKHSFRTPLRQYNYANQQHGLLYLMYISTTAAGGIDLDLKSRFLGSTVD